MQRFAPQPPTKTLKQELLLKIPRCTVHLMDDGDALELGKGEFKLVRVLDDDFPLATIIKVTDDLQWPLTKDEPVVKLDSVHYLFSLPVKDGKPLSYGVTFVGRGHGNSLSSLDSLLKEHSCFAAGVGSTGDKHVDWKAYAPRIEDYNNVLAKAIAGGTGQIVKGIFTCSNAYISQVQKGGETILRQPPGKTHGIISNKSNKNKSEANNNNLKRVRNLSIMTEKMSKTMLDMVGIASGTVMAPFLSSKPGQAFLSMLPGQVLLASLDAVNKVLDAVEVAEKQALSATSTAATRMMTDRYGERAGEATEDVLATAGNLASTAWNVFKIRKAITPKSTATSGLLNNASKYNTRKSY
ncbi:hypothetical protein ES288_A08G288200v1 [Gossypium darwinii]|uniref:Senescence domain-containing protein n=1 Tax=Gossypium darwinii TaxID=34276 RepID=A0A5D2FQ92_GOSDA|nr:hypothetical protein ES288_A08G288200v1 [Gossypium darwinii]